MSWEEVSKKQAENIGKNSTFKGFAPSDGICWRCGKNIAEGERGITVEKLGDYIITGCPHCHVSFCE